MTLRAFRDPNSSAAEEKRPSQGEAMLTVVGDETSIDRVQELVATLGPDGTNSALFDALLRVVAAMNTQAGRDREVIRLFMPASLPTEAHAIQLARNAEARTEAIREWGAFTAAELAKERRVKVANPHATAGRWLREHLVFAVDGPRERLFPGFQFADGRPKPAVARVLQALPRGLSGWETLLWWTGNDGHLDGARPVDLIDRDPERVAAAAAYLAASLED